MTCMDLGYLPKDVTIPNYTHMDTNYKVYGKSSHTKKMVGSMCELKVSSIIYGILKGTWSINFTQSLYILNKA